MQLSNQAIGAIMMALQESLLHQTDIVPVFKHWDLEQSDEGLIVKNPPTVRVPKEFTETTDSRHHDPEWWPEDPGCPPDTDLDSDEIEG